MSINFNIWLTFDGVIGDFSVFQEADRYLVNTFLKSAHEINAGVLFTKSQWDYFRSCMQYRMFYPIPENPDGCEIFGIKVKVL